MLKAKQQRRASLRDRVERLDNLAICAMGGVALTMDLPPLHGSLLANVVVGLTIGAAVWLRWPGPRG